MTLSEPVMRTSFLTKTLTASVMMTMTATAYANGTVSAIEFHGLNRVTPQSLQVVLPLGVGQTLTADALADSIRAYTQPSSSLTCRQMLMAGMWCFTWQSVRSSQS